MILCIYIYIYTHDCLTIVDAQLHLQAAIVNLLFHSGQIWDSSALFEHCVPSCYLMFDHHVLHVFPHLIHRSFRSIDIDIHHFFNKPKYIVVAFPSHHTLYCLK